MFGKIKSYCLYVIEYSSLIEEFPELEKFLNFLKSILEEEKKISVQSLMLILDNYHVMRSDEFFKLKELLSYYKECYIDFEK